MAMLRTRCGKPVTAFAALGALLFVAATAMGAEPERVRFTTADYAEIQGLYYASDLGIKAPTVLMLHPVGSSIEAPGWSDLAKKLQEKHYAVLTFDFRGHGNSVNVSKDFWNAERSNQSLKGYKPVKPKLTISHSDFRTASNILSLENDISAAKRFLDAKNDASECNSAKLIVIGAGTGATLGAAWINSEWRRRALKSGFPVINNTQAEGHDVAAAVWLSMASSVPINNTRWTPKLETYLASPVRDNVPMLFLYGEQDTRAAHLAKSLHSSMAKNVKDKKLKELDREVAIKDTKLSGVELLGKKDTLRTEEKIIAYLEQVLEDRLGNPWAKKDVDKTAFTVFPISFYLR
jgi:pimeloyl-ACP methyl ester carboxylesterase